MFSALSFFCLFLSYLFYVQMCSFFNLFLQNIIFDIFPRNVSLIFSYSLFSKLIFSSYPSLRILLSLKYNAHFFLSICPCPLPFPTISPSSFQKLKEKKRKKEMQCLGNGANYSGHIYKNYLIKIPHILYTCTLTHTQTHNSNIQVILTTVKLKVSVTC